MRLQIWVFRLHCGAARYFSAWHLGRVLYSETVRTGKGLVFGPAPFLRAVFLPQKPIDFRRWFIGLPFAKQVNMCAAFGRHGAETPDETVGGIKGLASNDGTHS